MHHRIRLPFIYIYGGWPCVTHIYIHLNLPFDLPQPPVCVCLCVFVHSGDGAQYNRTMVFFRLSLTKRVYVVGDKSHTAATKYICVCMDLMMNTVSVDAAYRRRRLLVFGLRCGLVHQKSWLFEGLRKRRDGFNHTFWWEKIISFLITNLFNNVLYRVCNYFVISLYIYLSAHRTVYIICM